MKNIKLLAIFMALSMSGFMQADFTANAGTKINVYNMSDVSVTLKWTGVSPTADVSKTFAVYSASAAAATPSLTSFIYAAGKYSGVTVTYGTETTSLSFAPTTVPTAIYIYGKSSVAMSSLDITVATAPLASRYVAWWTGTINLTTYPTVDTAITAAAAALQPVTMYMMSLDGKAALAF